MDTGRECGPGRAELSSRPGVTRVASDSRRDPHGVVPLRTSRDFERVFRSGRRVRAGPLVVVTAVGLPGRVRLGLVAGRRIGPAVDRNRVKRRLRHAVREAAVSPGTDVVVIGSRAALSADFVDLVRWIERGCAQEADDGR